MIKAELVIFASYKEGIDDPEIIGCSFGTSATRAIDRLTDPELFGRVEGLSYEVRLHLPNYGDKPPTTISLKSFRKMEMAQKFLERITRALSEHSFDGLMETSKNVKIGEERA